MQLKAKRTILSHLGLTRKNRKGLWPFRFLVRVTGVEYPSGTRRLCRRRPLCCAGQFLPPDTLTRKNRKGLWPSRFLVRVTGVEPARLSAREPKSRMSANSIIPAYYILNDIKKTYRYCDRFLWSGLRGSNSLPPPWQGGALPDELKPHQQRML